MLIEIKAELLKHCPYGFEFYIGAERRSLLVYDVEELMYESDCNRRWMDTDTIVKVDADEYRDACIERIKSVVSRVLKIEKYKNGDIVAIVSCPLFAILEIDPWPHLETAEWEA